MRSLVTQIIVTLFPASLLLGVHATAWAQPEQPPAREEADADEEPDAEAPAESQEPAEPAAGDEGDVEAETVDAERGDEGSEDAEAQAPATSAGEPTSVEGAAPLTEPAAAKEEDEPTHRGSFGFGSYGRLAVASDGYGRPARDADIVAHGSRLDHDNYVELELRRDDHWDAVDADTRFVATLALGNPIFHYNGELDARLAVRNLYIEERNLGLEGLGFWVGSRMLRGDDIYLLDFWPLDNLNTLGAGIDYQAPTHTTVSLHMGVAQPHNPFYQQQAERAAPLNQFGTATIDLLDRQRWTGSLRAEQQIRFDDGAGLKMVAYGELHQLPSGQRETSRPRVYEDLPHDDGWVLGGQLGAFTGDRDTHVNLFVRYARGMAAYGAFAQPSGLAPDKTTSGARELLFAVGGNVEFGPATVMLGAYFRSFRNGTEDLDFEDVDEGIVMVRPHVFFVDWAGLALEGSFQAQQRGVLADIGEDVDPTTSTNPQPFTARVSRLGVIPFITPAGRGSFSRPMFWFIYSAAFRDEGARALYPQDDVLSSREVEHFIGVGAEWWFGSTSYGEAP